MVVRLVARPMLDESRRRRIVLGIAILGGLQLAPPSLFAQSAQQGRLYRVGVLQPGGVYADAFRGLRDGLKELGLAEGTHVVFHVRETKGDPRIVETAARELEGEKVDLIYALATSATMAARRATRTVPIVFVAGTDPVAVGLVKSYSRPGGRLTGVYERFTDLTAKRLQLLKEIVPGLRRIAAFYNPSNPIAQRSVKDMRQAVRQLNMELVERPVGTIEEFRAGLAALRPGEVDAICDVPDVMVVSQSHLIVEIATAKRLPAIFSDEENVQRGGLVAYGQNRYLFGRLSAKHVQRILQGANPAELPVEQIDRLHLVVNLKTARLLGITVPQTVLLRADRIIE
jgi:putative ABC transport system substrate-binding protein